MPDTFYIHACCFAVAWAIELDAIALNLDPFEVLKCQRRGVDRWEVERGKMHDGAAPWVAIMGPLDDDDMAQPYRHALTGTDPH